MQAHRERDKCPWTGRIIRETRLRPFGRARRSSTTRSSTRCSSEAGHQAYAVHHPRVAQRKSCWTIGCASCTSRRSGAVAVGHQHALEFLATAAARLEEFAGLTPLFLAEVLPSPAATDFAWGRVTSCQSFCIVTLAQKTLGDDGTSRRGASSDARLMVLFFLVKL